MDFGEYQIRNKMLVNDQPLISIIVPIYNVERYLEKCIESILTQTYTNLELILVDDGSPDRCPVICDEFAKKDNRIVVIHKKNGGLSDARNAGLDIAQGKFIGFVDGDDYIDPQMYEILFDALFKNDADMSICNYVKVNEQYELITEKNNILPIKDACISPDEFMHGYTGKYGWFYVIACNKLYRKKLFDKCRYPIGKQHEDAFLIHHIVYNCRKIACIKAPLYYYVEREGSIMSKKNIKNMDLCEALIDQYFYAHKHKRCILKEYAVRRLSFEMEKWAEISDNNVDIKKKYHQLRKKAFFLVWEKKAWQGYSASAQIYYRIGIVSPSIAKIMRKLRHV